MTNKNKKKAIALRKSGLTYTEINKRINVSKSTLSYWLRDIELTDKQKKRIKKKIAAGQPFGARAQRKNRIEKTKKIVKKAKNQIGKISDQDLLYIGTVLYWAEGSKQKKHNPSQRVVFNNSDPKMIKLLIKWFKRCLKVKGKDIDFEIYSHENIRHKENKVIRHWADVTGFPEAKFDKIYYKKDKKKKYRKNQGESYYGLLRIKVKKSTDLNRKIAGWFEGICEQCGVV